MKPFVITSVLAPTDLSNASIPALRYARLFADRFLAKLTVMYTEPVMYPADLADGLFIDTSAQRQATLRKEIENHAGAIMKGRPYDIDVTTGLTAPTILAVASERNADFIVVGAHLRHGWRRAFFGSVGESVLHGSECPVLTVGTRDGEVAATSCAVTNIICPVNFTEVARDSVHAAARLAEAFGASLTFVHVLEEEEGMDAKADEERVRRWVSPELQDICSYRELVVRGGAAERVLDCADDIGSDLLVIGAQHRLFRDETVLGTTTERLIRFASCPVLVVSRQAVRPESKATAPEEIGAMAER